MCHSRVAHKELFLVTTYPEQISFKTSNFSHLIFHFTCADLHGISIRKMQGKSTDLTHYLPKDQTSGNWEEFLQYSSVFIQVMSSEQLT